MTFIVGAACLPVTQDRPPRLLPAKSTRQRAHPQGTNARNRQVGTAPAWGYPVAVDKVSGFRDDGLPGKTRSNNQNVRSQDAPRIPTPKAVGCNRWSCAVRHRGSKVTILACFCLSQPLSRLPRRSLGSYGARSRWDRLDQLV
jgi:hypothetical protein